jgi:hypothetical protein
VPADFREFSYDGWFSVQLQGGVGKNMPKKIPSEALFYLRCAPEIYFALRTDGTHALYIE